MQTYDLIVIGAGAAGTGAALTAAEMGKRVALVEKDHFGGSCTNYGCDPSKRLLYTADMLAQAAEMADFGLQGGEGVRADWTAVQRRLNTMVTQMRGGETVKESGQFYEERGIDVYSGAAHFLSPHDVLVGETTLSGDHILISAGSRPIVPDIPGLDSIQILTNQEALYLPLLPASLLIVGGGPVGVEFAQMFSRFGVAVTLVEMADHILPQDDGEMAGLLAEQLAAEGIDILVATALQRVKGGPKGVTAVLETTSGAMSEVVVERVILAVGRAPDVASLNLAVTGVETNGDGWIAVDETLRTSVDHIWAAGDITGGLQFTHVASKHGPLAARNAFADEPEAFDGTAIPWVTYTSPALAHVGATSASLQGAHVAHTVIRKPVAEMSRAKIERKPAGMIKLVVGADGRLLGGTILAPRAGELLGPLCLALRHGLAATAVADTIFPYPTWVAEVGNAAGQAGQD